MFSALSYPQKLAGVAVLSCWLPMLDTFNEFLAASDKVLNHGTRIFMGHGIEDRMIPPRIGKRAYDDLMAAGFGALQWEVYP